SGLQVCSPPGSTAAHIAAGQPGLLRPGISCFVTSTRTGYMRRFVLGWKQLGHERRLRAYVVNYADDLVICCRASAEEALATMRRIMGKLKLTVNETKTRVCKLPEEKFDFLGYTFGRCYSPKTGRAYLGTVPSKKRVTRVCDAISSETGRSTTLL